MISSAFSFLKPDCVCVVVCVGVCGEHNTPQPSTCSEDSGICF